MRALAPETLEAFLTLRRAQPQVHATTLLRQLQANGVLAPRSVSISTMYRALAREGLDRAQRAGGQRRAQGADEGLRVLLGESVVDDRRDVGAVGAAGAGRQAGARAPAGAARRLCSRLCTHGQYYAAERIECFLDVLKQALQARGIPEKLYTDNGSLFVSEHLRTVCANFGIRLITPSRTRPGAKGRLSGSF